MKTILAIVVLYRMRADQSAAYRSLQHALQQSTGARNAFELLICDNTPCEQPSPLEFHGTYRRDLSNPGLAACYNFALRTATEQGVPWLLLLDQDTTVTQEYLDEIVLRTADSRTMPEVVAFVPKLTQNGAVQSPHVAPTFRHRALDPRATGLCDQRLYAFNSGSALRVEALQAIGGFPEEFWLDFLDHATFHTLQTHGGRIFVLKASLAHDLSANSVERKDAISKKRYQNILDAEHRFYQLHGSFKDKVFHRIRLMRGALGTFIKKRHFADALQMLKAAVRI